MPAAQGAVDQFQRLLGGGDPALQLLALRAQDARAAGTAAHHPITDKDTAMTTLSARADVPTATPARYAKQLVSHLGRRTTWTTDGDTSTAELAGGTGRVVVGDGMLTLIASAPDRETLTQVQHVLGSHLERFGQRSELTVTWVSAAERGGGPTPPAPPDHHRPTDL